MLKTAIVAFTTFFATIGPVDVAALFAALTTRDTPAQRRVTAIKATLVAASLLLLFAFFGQTLLDHLGISLAAFRTAGGILLLLIGIDMVFARQSGGTSTTADENREARRKEDISVFPLATPLIAGPGAMGAVILLVARTEGDYLLTATVIGALLLVLSITLLLLLMANQVQKLLGVTGIHVITRVFGILLTALAVQFIFDGIAASRMLSAEHPTGSAPPAWSRD